MVQAGLMMDLILVQIAGEVVSEQIIVQRLTIAHSLFIKN